MAIGKFEDDENIEFQLKKLKSPDIIVNIINEYANGGFEIINRKLKDDPDYFYEHNKFIEDLIEQPTQKPYTFAIRMSHHLTNNCKRVCLANAEIKC